MSPPAATDRRSSRPLTSWPGRLSLAAALLVLAAACGGATAGAPAGETPASGPPSPTAVVVASSPTPDPMASADLRVDPCQTLYATQAELDSLRAVELRTAHRVALDIELGKVQVAFDELREADFGELAQQVEAPLTRLGYRLIDLELAVEDFRTTQRMRPAATHVEEETQRFGDALAAFAILARC